MFRVQLKMSQRHSRRHSSRRCSRSRSRSGSHGRKSHSRSCSPGYCRRRSLSTSPMSNLRRHAGSRSHNFTKEAYSHGRGADIRANPDPSTCVGLFGLSVYTTECDLKEVFSSYGPLAGVNVVDDQRTGCFRGFAFVYFERLDDSKVAMELANGVELEREAHQSGVFHYQASPYPQTRNLYGPTNSQWRWEWQQQQQQQQQEERLIL